eukprot:COSAG02_NODE_7965_length_2768_cov_45.347321_5_plen_57_part_01
MCVCVCACVCVLTQGIRPYALCHATSDRIEGIHVRPYALYHKSLRTTPRMTASENDY